MIARKMNIFEKKIKIRKKKKLLKIINCINVLDETSISYHGDKKNKFFLLIKESIEKAQSLKLKLPKWILNLNGMSGRKYRKVINNIIKHIDNPKYLEIGCWTGSTSCSAIYKNNLQATFIDNWSQKFNNQNNPCKIFFKNLEKSNSKNSNLRVINKDFNKVNFNDIGKFNIYFYDASHHKVDHFNAMYLTRNCLEENYIVIIDDWNWKQVREGTYQGLEKNKDILISQIQIRTTQDDSRPITEGLYSDWHNGYSFFIMKKN